MQEIEIHPKVSIVIPIFNGANYMRFAIDSAINQTYKNIEILVINDGSTDETEDIALSYGDKIKYFSKENGGQASALNLGLEKMTGEFFSWLSHDDVYYPTRVQRLVDTVNRSLEYKLANLIPYCLAEYIDVEGKKMDIQDVKIDINRIKDEILHLKMINLCTLLIPVNLFNHVGKFNINRPHTADGEMLYNLSEHAKFVCCEEVLFQSRKHPGQMTYSRFSYHLNECSLLYIDCIDKLCETEKQQYFEENKKYFVDLAILWAKGSYDSAYKYIVINYLPEYSVFFKLFILLRCFYHSSYRKLLIRFLGLTVKGRKLI